MGGVKSLQAVIHAFIGEDCRYFFYAKAGNLEALHAANSHGLITATGGSLSFTVCTVIVNDICRAKLLTSLWIIRKHFHQPDASCVLRSAPSSIGDK